MKRLFVAVLILFAVSVSSYGQNTNTDKNSGKVLSEQMMLFNSYMATPEGLRFIPANYIYEYHDSLYYGTPGDSIANLSLPRACWWMISYKDTGYTEAAKGLRDSIKIEYYDSLNNSWGLVGVKSLVDGTAYSDVIYSGSSYTRGFWFYTPVPFDHIRITLLNQRGRAPTRKGYFTLRSVR